ncbi:MAG: OsmC family protein [Solobacterium sp.]|nr:OsmC family protein [Solobacterium sp.]MBQ1382900.1 OsmC family protein [Solobacterium sp.]
MLIKTTLKEDGTTVESESRGLTVSYNTKDRNVGMNPGELMLSALGGCMTGIASEMAGEFGIDLKAFSVDVEGISAADHSRPGFAEIHTTVHMSADITPEKAEEFVAEIEQICPIRDVLANGSHVHHTIDLNK